MNYNQNLYGRLTINPDLINIFYPPPPESIFLVTDGGDMFVTEDGDEIIVD